MRLRSIAKQWESATKMQKEPLGFVAPVTEKGVPHNFGKGGTKGTGHTQQGLGFQPQRCEQRKCGRPLQIVLENFFSRKHRVCSSKRYVKNIRSE